MKPRVTVPCLTAAALAAFAHPLVAGQRAPSQPASITAPVERKPNPEAPRVSATRAVPPELSEYRIGNGDKLRIEVYKDLQLSQSVQVRPDGRITLPLVGDLEATDQTPIQLRDIITNALKEYVTDPTVTVIVVEATAATAYVMGEVNHPGAVTLQGGPLTVLQALAMAGGFKDFADINNIRILRKAPTGMQTIAFKYKEAIRGAPPVYLRTGDTVVVPD
jgi:polysaccharide export outer membrane protein